jgi:hypothetical protein
MADTDTSTEQRRQPRFNHVAMSMPADALDETGRKEIVEFYREVFGWEELPTLTEDRHRLVLQAYTYEQFVFLIADEPHMTCPGLDHFGMSVGTAEELDELLARTKAFAARDERVEIIDRKVEDYGMLKLHSFYVRYLLPLMIEVQHFEWAGSDAPAAAEAGSAPS